MKFIETKLPGVYIMDPQVHGDYRGWFMETHSDRTMEEAGLNYRFVQDNISYTAKKNTLRGLHFQNNPMAQAKMIRVARGAVLDVVVDIRRGSPQYLQWVSVELTEENKRQILIPRGFAHGFLTLRDDVEFVYKVDNLYSPENDRGICFDDPSINVNWGTDAPILSQRDQSAPLLVNSDCNFIYEEGRA